ncbi:hypothetical protein R6Q59_015158 [Mikania micrantha]
MICMVVQHNKPDPTTIAIKKKTITNVSHNHQILLQSHHLHNHKSMAEVVVSAVLSVLLENLTSEALKTIARYKGIDAEIKKLHRLLTLIQDVLADASRKEITGQSVKRWLNDFQHLAYDIEDVLDELATGVMEREFNRESEAISRKHKVLKKRIIIEADNSEEWSGQQVEV